MSKSIEHLGTYEKENGDYFEIYEETTEDGRTRLFSGSPTNNTILEDGNEVFYESSFEKQDALEELVENLV
jgi:hypothetical protein